MMFIFTKVVAMTMIVPGVGTLVPGAILLFQHRHRFALPLLLAALLVLALVLTLLSWSLSQLHVFCPANPAVCG